MNTMIDRQGDVFIIPVKEIPKEATPIEGTTLALGEVTGHSHRFPPGAIAMFKYNEKTYMRVKEDLATLTHEEHGALTYTKGDYEIRIQREYSPEGWKYVAD